MHTMKTFLKALLLVVLAVGFGWLLWFLTQNQTVVLLEPKGSIAEEERNLMVIAGILMLTIVLPVFALTALIAWRYRASNSLTRYMPNLEHNTAEEFVWWSVPCVIIIVLAGITWKTTHELDPFKPMEGTAPLTIQVVALNWKWLFIYPQERIAAVNFVEFPVYTPVRFFVTSDAPMNSFWIPQIGGQIYAMAGMKSQLNLAADTPGDYAGLSANFSGSGFAGMKFTARAVTQEEFAAWVRAVKKNSTALDRNAYAKLAEPSEYDAAALYGVVEDGLFDRIITKYMHGYDMRAREIP